MSRRVTARAARRCNHCGWRSRVMTPGRADYALRRHSCDRHRSRQAMAERVEARKNADGPCRDCQHKKANHEHGTYAAFVLDRCRCRPCRDAHRTYNRRRNQQVSYGRWQPYVDAQPARLHVQWLATQNIGLKQIAKVAAVSQGCLWKLVYGKRRPDGTRTPSKRIRREVSDAILAVQPTLDMLGGGAKVGGTGTRRRLQALVAMGYSMAEVGRRIGITNIHRVVHGANGELVFASTARAACGLYDELWDVLPPESDHRQRISAARARNYARAHNWPSPLAWDDESIDDPIALPMRDADEAVAS